LILKIISSWALGNCHDIGINSLALWLPKSDLWRMSIHDGFSIGAEYMTKKGQQ
jgi:hypothetical protein